MIDFSYCTFMRACWNTFGIALVIYWFSAQSFYLIMTKYYVLSTWGEKKERSYFAPKPLSVSWWTVYESIAYMKQKNRTREMYDPSSLCMTNFLAKSAFFSPFVLKKGKTMFCMSNCATFDIFHRSSKIRDKQLCLHDRLWEAKPGVAHLLATL